MFPYENCFPNGALHYRIRGLSELLLYAKSGSKRRLPATYLDYASLTSQVFEPGSDDTGTEFKNNSLLTPIFLLDNLMSRGREHGESTFLFVDFDNLSSSWLDHLEIYGLKAFGRLGQLVYELKLLDEVSAGEYEQKRYSVYRQE